MSFRIYTVLPEVGLGTFREALRRYPQTHTELEVCGNLLEAIQKVYLLGPPDLLVLDAKVAGPSFGATLQELRTQPGFQDIRVAAVTSPGTDPPGETSPDIHRLPFPTFVGMWLEFLAGAFPSIFPPAPQAPTGGVPPPIHPRAESRAARRKSLSAPCIVWAGAKKISGKLKDISMTGARVFVDAELPVSGHTHLTVAVPGSQPLKLIQFKALVVRWEPGGYGLCFKEMDQETRHFLKGYTEGKVLESTPT